MRKITLIFLIVFLISASVVMAQKVINANTLDRSSKLRLEQISAGIFNSNSLNIQSLNKWKALVFDLQKRGKYDWNSLIRYILDKFKQHTNKSTEFYKKKFNTINRLKNQVNNHIIYLRRMKARLAARGSGNIKIQLKNILAIKTNRKNLIKLKYSSDKDNSNALNAQAQESLGLPDQVPPEGATTPEELDALLESWDEKLQNIGKDAELANIEMKNMLQKQQQTMQMMSQISKLLHDSVMDDIREMDG